MADKPGILRNLRIKRVALVDNGANFDKATGDGAHIYLFKRDITKNPSVASVHVDAPMGGDDEPETDYEKANLTTDQRNSLADSDFAAVWTDAQGKKHRKLPIHDAGHLAAARGRVDAANIPADVKASAKRRIEGASSSKEKSMKKNFWKGLVALIKETDPAKQEASIAAMEKDFPMGDGDADDKIHKADDPMCKCADCVSMRAEKLAKSGDAVMKAAVEAVRTEMQKKVDEATKAANDATTIAKAEREARLDTEMSAVLKGFRSIPFDMKDNADVKKFRKMKEDDPDLYDRTMAIFKAAEAQLTTSGIYKQYGSGMSGGDGGDAWGELVAKADALVEKSTSGLTQEVALDKVMQDPRNNKIVKRYREHQQASH